MLRSHSGQVLSEMEIMTAAHRRILVIEDDAETAQQIVDFLTARGYQADLAANGNEGLRLGQSAVYAVMTIDRMLPGMDGIDDHSASARRRDRNANLDHQRAWRGRRSCARPARRW